MIISGYKRSFLRTLLCWSLICLTGGLLRLIMHWWQHWYLVATHVQCPLEIAEKVLIQEAYQGKHTIYYVKTVQELNASQLKETIAEESHLQSSLQAVDEGSSYSDTLALQTHRKKFRMDESCFQLSFHFSSAQFKRTLTRAKLKGFCKVPVYSGY